MKTRLTETFQIDHPIILSGMSWISTPELVAEVCNAGGLGILATGVLSGADTRDYIRRTRELSSRPFFSRPIMVRSIASSNSAVVISLFLRRAPSNAASLASAARSAPANPGVRAATDSKSTSAAMERLRV